MVEKAGVPQESQVALKASPEKRDPTTQGQHSQEDLSLQNREAGPRGGRGSRHCHIAVRVKTRPLPPATPPACSPSWAKRAELGPAGHRTAAGPEGHHATLPAS